MSKSYWGHDGAYQAAYDRLAEMIPQEGECDPSTPALEKLRVASNAYYDIFNNGGCNRAKDIQAIFGLVIGEDETFTSEDTWAYRHTRTEPVLDRLILEAATEAWMATPVKGQEQAK